MRDTKDIADAVFRIRDEYLEQKKIKHIRIERAGAAVSAIAAAGIITAGAVHFSSGAKKPVVPETENVIVTSVSTEAAAFTSAPVSTYTTAAANSAASKPRTSSGTNGTVSTISSTVTKTASNTRPAVSAASQPAVKADTSDSQTPIATDINDIDYEEVIRMKVISIKKYLAALSAAAISASAVNMPVNAESLYTPKELDPLADAVLFIEDNPELMDFDGNGKLDGFDAYALFTYLNEPESLPDGAAERCSANADFNKDGIIDTLDTDLFREMCFMKYINNSYVVFTNNMNYLLPAGSDYHEHVYRTISPDAPAEMRELLLNEFVDESYTYGSDENRNAFMDYCFSNYKNYSFPNEYTFDKYNDAYYKRFAQEADRVGYSFDVNDDGAADIKDLYDIYIYDVASADEGGMISKDSYFAQFNFVEERKDGMICTHNDYEHPLRSRLPLPEEFKQQLWAKCEPIYKYVYQFIEYNEENVPLSNYRVFELIARYIISKNLDFDLINTNNLYFMQIHGDLILCDHSVNEIFTGDLSYYMRKFLSKEDDPGYNDIYHIDCSDKIFDYETRDTEQIVPLIARAKADFESGLTKDMYDVNKDGKTDIYDSYTFDLYLTEMCSNIPMENSVLPADVWKYIDEKLDVDYDGKPGTLGDQLIFFNVIGSPYEGPSYKFDIYYLQLVEQKGLADLSDIRPFIEKLCKDKEAGDVDLDGNVTAVDASKVLNYYAKTSVNEDISTVTEAQMKYMADINTDGIIDSVDAAAILSAYARYSVEG